MSYSARKRTAKRLSEQASFVVEITSDDELCRTHAPSASKCRAMMVRWISELPS